MCTGGGCEAAVTARTKCWLAMLRECGQFLYGQTFPLMLQGAVCMSYIGPAILYGSEAWCLKVSEKGILQSTERFMSSAMCGVQLNDRRAMDLMLMQGLMETICQFVITNSVFLFHHVLWREVGHS